MDLMKRLPDKSIDLAIVDPPYFSGPEKRKYYGYGISSKNVARLDYLPVSESWEVPGNEYYQELLRVSKHQIIWGINYFNDFREVSPGRIIWDKVNQKSSFSDCEIAACSLINTVKLFRFMWNGMCQGKSAAEGHIMQGNKSLNEKRIHPTQKPVILYKWLLSEYASPGQKILDTHVGSNSIGIACHDLGFDLIGSEINNHYFLTGLERLQSSQRQLSLFA